MPPFIVFFTGPADSMEWTALLVFSIYTFLLAIIELLLVVHITKHSNLLLENINKYNMKSWT